MERVREERRRCRARTLIRVHAVNAGTSAPDRREETEEERAEVWAERETPGEC